MFQSTRPAASPGLPAARDPVGLPGARSRFQSTRPARGATQPLHCSVARPYRRCFNPRAPRGARPSSAIADLGGRFRCPSIHAPREGATQPVRTSNPAAAGLTCFNPRVPGQSGADILMQVRSIRRRTSDSAFSIHAPRDAATGSAHCAPARNELLAAIRFNPRAPRKRDATTMRARRH